MLKNQTEQSCGSDPGSGAFLTPGSGMGKNPELGSGIRDEHPGSYFSELTHPGSYFSELSNFFELKILKFFNAAPGSCQPWIRNGKKSDPG
jgi:hypothetical protein